MNRADGVPNHPAAYELDAAAAGDVVARVTSHLETCGACARYVTELRTQAASFDGGAAAQALLAKVQAKAEAGTKTREQRSSARRARWTHVGMIAGPILAAAAVALLVRRLPSSAPSPEAAGTTGAVHVETPSNPAGESHFKGGLVVAVIRERASHQERLAGPFTVRAGDRVRVEVSTDGERPLTAGLLTDDGEWVALLAPVALEAGTHYSERDARFDETKTQATLLVGEPGAVRAAQVSRDFSQIVAWRVVSEPSP